MSRYRILRPTRFGTFVSVSLGPFDALTIHARDQQTALERARKLGAGSECVAIEVDDAGMFVRRGAA